MRIVGILTSFINAFVIPKSPRWLLAQGRNDEALAILEKAAQWNKTSLVSSTRGPREIQTGCDKQGVHAIQLKREKQQEDRNVWKLVSPEWRRKSFFVWFLWAGSLFDHLFVS